MNRRQLVVASLAIAIPSPRPTRAQFLDPYDVPSAATIRGENIWLRVDPAEETDIVTYLQRGDEVTLTDEAVMADGSAFVPVETATGETGWVRDLAIDPRSLEAASEPARVARREARGGAAEPEAEPRANRRANRTADDETVAVDVPEVVPVPVEEAPAPEPSTPEEAPAAGPAPIDPAAVGGSPENPAPTRMRLRGSGFAVIVGGGRFDTAPAAGSEPAYRFLDITVRIDNIGTDETTYASDNFRAQDPTSGETFESVVAVVDTVLTSGSVPPRETVSGVLRFKVQEATGQALVTFMPERPDSAAMYWLVP